MHFEITLLFTFTFMFNNVLAVDFCEKYETCNECIRNPYGCSWCSMDGLKRGQRCRSFESKTKDWCLNHLKYPTSSINVVDDEPFSASLGKIVQIKPQKYKVKLRPGQAINFNFSYQEATDYPVDIYFLIDASKSMSYIKSETAKQSKNIYAAISNMTSNLSLGLGTFVDKNTIPFVNATNSSLTYSFKHHLKLTSSYKTLRDAINNAPPGDNFDYPEGGLDALAQVLLCNSEIGWRNNSRKIIAFLTDAPYHAAGDGKIAGMFKPFDGHCYTKNGVYLKELEMDYPSVGMINKLAMDKGVTIIFAVKNDMQSVYAKLSSAVHESRVTTYDSGDMALILKNIYEEITKSIKMKVKTKHRNNIDIKFNPDCVTEQKKVCDIKTGQQKQFNGTIKLLEYFETNTFPVEIMITGIGDKITLEIDIIKECNCTNDYSSIRCNKSGNYRCGICQCNANRFGDECQCAATSSTKEFDNSTCISPGSTELCKGNGFCHCGSCICRSPFEGQYCQYNSADCKSSCHNNGDCIHGKCKCYSGWTGEACDCNLLEKFCTIGNKTCNDRGKCICGECRCQPLGSWDARNNQDSFCRVDPCLDCQGRQCRLLEKCALCHHSGNSNCSDCDEHININVTEKIQLLKTTDENWHTCHFKVNVWCYTHFIYRYDVEKYGIELLIPLEKDCVESYYKVGGSLLLAIILIGIGTLIGWKLLNDFRDRREYNRFTKERKHGDENTWENPCFVSSTTMYTNLAYAQSSTGN